MTCEKVAIIGAGPTGIASAVQLKRYGLEPFLFESDQAGGLVRNAWKIENYPGFPDGISGIELAGIMQKQLRKAGVLPIFQRVKKLTSHHDSEQFILQTDINNYRAGAVIVAAGTKAIRPNFVNRLPERINKRILSEVYPLLSIAEKRIIIIGAGDVGLDYTVNLARANDVIVINRSECSQALPLLKNLADKSGRISIMSNTEVRDVVETSEGRLEMSLEREGELYQIEADYIVAAIGREPADDFIDDEFRRYENDLIECGRLYYAGDISNGIYRQVGIAVGDGLMAAMRVFRKLKERKQCI